MFTVQIKNFEPLDRIAALWKARKSAWEKAGSKGKKPKLYETTEEVINAGLSKFKLKQKPTK
jgi:hypothetical protein